MTNIYKRIALVSTLLLFFMMPLFQSLLFDADTQGSIEINKNIDAKFIQSDKKIILLFFGYVGCADICTPLLQELSNLYTSKEFEIHQKDVEVLFINLTPEIDALQPDLFAKFFNKNFNGVYLSKKEILTLDRNFGLFFSQDLSDATQLNHTDYLYLIQNDKDIKTVKSIYTTHPLKTKKLIDDIILISSKK